jgi:hypothetical protein
MYFLCKNQVEPFSLGFTKSFAFYGEITLKPERKPRQGWAEAAKKLHQQKEDKLLIDDTLDLHPEEWEW